MRKQYMYLYNYYMYIMFYHFGYVLDDPAVSYVFIWYLIEQQV